MYLRYNSDLVPDDFYLFQKIFRDTTQTVKKPFSYSVMCAFIKRLRPEIVRTPRSAKQTAILKIHEPESTTVHGLYRVTLTTPRLFFPIWSVPCSAIQLLCSWIRYLQQYYLYCNLIGKNCIVFLLLFSLAVCTLGKHRILKYNTIIIYKYYIARFESFFFYLQTC